MSDNPTYTENIRKLTTAAEEDDAVTTGKILSELGPEKWSTAVKDMLDLNKKDRQDVFDKKNWSVWIPPLSAELERAGAKETLTVYHQPTYNMTEPLAVAKVTEDVSGKVKNPAEGSNDMIRQLTTAAENGDAVTTARILASVGKDKWGDVTKQMLDLNRKDVRERKEGTWVPNITVGYERIGDAESIKVYHQPEFFPPTPIAKVTERK